MICLWRLLKSWFSLMDEDGWIAREQILGEESRQKVPLEFRTQYPHYANPPTLLMPIAAFVERLQKSAPATAGSRTKKYLGLRIYFQRK